MSNATAPASGLEGVIAAHTEISSVDGEAGELVIRGFDIEQLGAAATFEETTFLLWYGRLPDARELASLRADLAGARELDAEIVDLLRAAAARGTLAMDALRMACAGLRAAGARRHASGDIDAEALRLVAALPTIVAAHSRLARGLEPVAPRLDLSQAANYLFMLSGEEPSPALVRALDTYWTVVSDHGLNASTFTARVIVSTRSDMVSAVTGAIGALKGALHGGAPGPALDLVLAIGDARRAEGVLREMLQRGERIMGFGHRIYRTRDPRADVLARAAERLFASDGDRQLYELARAVEEVALRLLREFKPDRRLATNVEFYTALLLHGIGLSTDLFTPTFAAGRVAGWTAHCLEQRRADRLYRPQSLYVGARERVWRPLAER